MTISEIHHVFLQSNGVCTDTRKLKKNTVFFSLSGENFNGNSYALKALDIGAKYVVVDDKKFYRESDTRYIFVENTLKTLQELATYHRNYLKLPIIALTGSNGKTTTKELIAAVLSRTYKIVATQGNLNNHIGVPLTLLRMDSETEIGIIEMGANHQKEIDFLCTIAQPDYGYITNIGKAHLEGFGGLEGVLKGKTELYRYLKKNYKRIFLNQDDPALVNVAYGIKKFTFSTNLSSSVDVKLTNITKSDFVSIQYNHTEIYSNLTGSYNFTNIACAITIGIYFKINLQSIKKGIESYTPKDNRSQIIEKSGFTLLLDAYNANPSSMKAALDNFDQMNFKLKFVILGDMFELGKYTQQEHEEIGEYAYQKKFEAIFLIGEHFDKITLENENIFKCKTKKDAIPLLQKHLKKPSAVLLKGSRGMKLEEFIEHF